MFLPVIVALAAGPGWRAAALVVTVATALLVPLVLLVLADSPAAVGTTPYGAVAPAPAAPAAGSSSRAGPEHRLRRRRRVAGAAGRADAGRELALEGVLDPGRHLLDLRLVDQRADPDPPHPGRARPRHAAGRPRPACWR